MRPSLKLKMPKLALFKNRLYLSAAKLEKEESGLAAIEFALLAPLLISMYFGLAEVASAVAVNRSVSHSANVVGDLASQVTNVDKDDMQDVMTATLRVLEIADPSSISIKIDSISRDASGKDTFVGQATLNAGAAALPAFNSAKVDKTLLNENAGIIVARVAYNYKPFNGAFLDSTVTMSDTFILKPRRSNVVTFANQPNKVFSCTSSGTNVTCS